MDNQKSVLQRLKVAGQTIEGENMQNLLNQLLQIISQKEGSAFAYQFVFEKDPLTINHGGDKELEKRLKQFNSQSALEQRQKRMESVKISQKADWEAIAKNNGLEYDKYLELAGDKIVKIIEKASVCVRAKVNSAISILNDGRFKSQFETDASGGTKNPQMRSRAEFNLFGFEQSVAKDRKLRPIYGFMSTYEEIGQDAATQYGQVIFVMKKEVRNRTTWCNMDSLRALKEDMIPTLLNASTVESLVHRMDVLNSSVSKIEDLISNQIWREYAEIQIHGQVYVKDIDEAIVDISRVKATDNYPELIRLLDEKGIKYKEINR